MKQLHIVGMKHHRCTRLMLFCLLMAYATLFWACAGSGRFVPPKPVPDDRRLVAEPKPRKINIAADVLRKQFFDQIKQSFDLARQYRNITGTKKEAYNLTAFDEVPNSSWFTNRNHLHPLTPEEVERGPNTEPFGPDPAGPWEIVSVKVEGVTPGVNIKDPTGQRYVIKFEPIGYSEMVSGAEVVSTKLFHAAGYNVPENYVVVFDSSILKLKPGVKFTDRLGRERDFNQNDLTELLKRIEKRPDGTVRAAASKFIKGSGFLGPFYYKNRRKDDANDLIPHQHRRELRGLRVIAAWLNHFDTKANNSLDVYTHEGYVKHYLIDFGSTLGSNGDEPMPSFIGHENAFDPHQVGLNTITLGLYVRPWERTGQVIYPSIGFFTSEGFHPQKYKFIQPNPAFELMTDRDGFWGAKIVMSFSDEQLAAAVAAGQYSDPEAADYLLKTIIERRDIVGRYWFNRVNPIDFISLARSNVGQTLTFVDLAVKTGLETVENSQYRYTIKRDGKMILPTQLMEESAAIPLPDDGAAHPASQWEVLLEVKRRYNNTWMKPLRAYLEWDAARNAFRLVGIRR